MRKVLAVLTALFVVVALVGAYGWFHRPALGEPLEIEIPSGATTTRVAEQLESERVISSTLAFRVLARIRGMDGRLQAGRYELYRGMGVQAALDALSRAPIEKGVTVPIPEGFSVRQVAERMGERTHLEESDFLEAATNGSVRASIQPSGERSLEGFLYPESYFVGENETAQDVVQRMVNLFEVRTRDLDWSYGESRGLSRYDVITMASLIEREARVDEDRPRIAAVIYNRLERGMRLQIDITALYGLDEHKVPTRRDLERPSPHNTYLIDGLPPTPIANPGLDAIRAALAPEDIDALYYVVIDPSGKHGFSRTLEEHERLRQHRPPGTF